MAGVVKMIKIEFTEAEKEALNYERYHHPHPRVQKKMEALWLKSQGISQKDICRLTGISANTLRDYIRDYLDGGIEKLKEINFYRPQSSLVEYQGTIEDYFRSKPPQNINEAMTIIEEMTGIKRSPTQVRLFLKSIGMRCLKVGFVPGKADLELQDNFKKKELIPRLDEAKKGKRAVFFVDASHFVMGAFLGWVW